ncbi:MAG: FxLYD domain-containing protein [Phycisphaerae bacterium]
MSKVLSARCGFCRKGFKLRPDQVGREVRCPHCKTIVKITPQTETGREAGEALRPALPGRREVAARRTPALPKGGVRSRNLAIVWVALIGVGIVGAAIGLVVAFTREKPAPRPVGHAPPPTYGVPGESPGESSGSFFGAGLRGREAVKLKVQRVIRGFKNSTQTYAVGFVTNVTAETLHTVKVLVVFFDRGDNELGEAHALVAALGPGETAPFVVVWEHVKGVRASKWAYDYEVLPAGLDQSPGSLLIKDAPRTQRDEGGFGTTGRVSLWVANEGKGPVEAVEVTAVMLDTKGEVAGAAKDVVRQRIEPGEEKDVSIRYERCRSELIRRTEVRVRVATP